MSVNLAHDWLVGQRLSQLAILSGVRTLAPTTGMARFSTPLNAFSTVLTENLAELWPGRTYMSYRVKPILSFLVQLLVCTNGHDPTSDFFLILKSSHHVKQDSSECSLSDGKSLLLFFWAYIKAYSVLLLFWTQNLDLDHHKSSQGCHSGQRNSHIGSWLLS